MKTYQKPTIFTIIEIYRSCPWDLFDLYKLWLRVTRNGIFRFKKLSWSKSYFNIFSGLE